MASTWARAHARELAARAGEAPPIWAKEYRWWEVYDNVVSLTRHMADRGYSAADVAYAVEKPWKFEDLWKEIDEGTDE